MKSSKNINTINKVSKLCESALIAINAYDMTAQSLAGLYEEGQKEAYSKIENMFANELEAENIWRNTTDLKESLK